MDWRVLDKFVYMTRLESTRLSGEMCTMWHLIHFQFYCVSHLWCACCFCWWLLWKKNLCRIFNWHCWSDTFQLNLDKNNHYFDRFLYIYKIGLPLQPNKIMKKNLCNLHFCVIYFFCILFPQKSNRFSTCSKEYSH